VGLHAGRVADTAHAGGIVPTPLRSLRIDDERWDRLLAKAEDEGTTASEVLRKLIDAYLEES